MATNRYKTVLKKIILKLGKGLKSSKKEYCLGEEIDLQLEEIIVPSEGVKAVPPTDLNTLARWNKADGSELTGSKTTQDNDGNTSTRTSFDGNLSYITSNESEDENSTAVHAVESKGGRPINRLFIPAKQLVDSYISNTDYSYNVFLNDIENAGLAATCLKINRKGNVTHPFQWQAFAILTENTGNINSEVEYYLGQGTPLTIIENQGGFFSAGGGSVANAAKFTIFEPATFLVYLCAVVQRNGNNQVEIQSRIRVLGSQARSTGFINIIPPTFGKNSCSVLGGVKGLPGDVINFTVQARTGGNSWFIPRTIGDTYTTFIGIYCLG